MKPDKRKKIRAMLNNPASTENEKEICRKLLKAHPEEKPHFDDNVFNESMEDAFRRQTAQAQNFAFYNQHVRFQLLLFSNKSISFLVF